MPDARELAPEALVDQYIHVLNRSLGENRDRFPYREILAASEKLFDDTGVAVGIYKDDPGAPHHWFTVDFAGGSFALREQGKGDADLNWRVRQAHMEEVVDNPEVFVRDPYKLDLDWLKKTLGIEG
jgi:hypothetical protein